MSIPSSSEIFITLFLFMIALGSCALFAFLETSVATLKLFTIEELERAVRCYPRLFAALRFHRHRVLTTMVIANSGATVIATTFSTRLLLLLFHNTPQCLELPLTLVCTTSIMLLCGEVIPKHLAKALGNHLMRYTLWATDITYKALYPLVTILTALSERVVRYVARSQDLDESIEEQVSREEIQFLMGYMHKTGGMSDLQYALLTRVFTLHTLQVATIMLPISAGASEQLCAADNQVPDITPVVTPEDTVERAVALLVQYKATRIPVHSRQGILVGIIRQHDVAAILLGEKVQNFVDNPVAEEVSLQRTVVAPFPPEDRP